MLLAGIGLPFLARAGVAGSSSLPDGAELLIAGPSGGRLDRLSMDLLPALQRGLPAGTPLQREFAGGPDGVTGANRFEARGTPDGASVLLMPGDAALAWLVGDPRARFSLGSLVPIMSGVTCGVLMSRLPLDQIGPGKRLRMAALRPDGPDLAGLLGLDLLGLQLDPTFSGSETAAVERAILGRRADALFVVGPDTPKRVARLAAAGLAPAFVLGVAGEDGTMRRDPLLPDVPTLAELAVRMHGAVPSGLLYDAWRAVAAAVQLSFLLALPPLTPASLVSLWRQSGAHAAATIPPVEAGGMRLIACPETTAFTAPIASVDTASLIELRQWLALRLGWQPA